MNWIKKGIYQGLILGFCILLNCTVCFAGDMTYGGSVDDWGNVWIIKDSDRRIIDESEVSWMNEEQRQMAINEIYARRGRKFVMDTVRQYFENQQWYVGAIEPENFTDSMLSEIERTNIEIIKNAEYQEVADPTENMEYFSWGGAYRNEETGMILCIAEIGYNYSYSVCNESGRILNYEEEVSVINDILPGDNYNIHKKSDGSLQVITVEAEDYGYFYKINKTTGCDSWFQGKYIASDGYIKLEVYDQQIDRNDANLPSGAEIAILHINAEHDFQIDTNLYTQADGSLAIVEGKKVIGNIIFENGIAYITGSDLSDIYTIYSENDVQKNETSSSMSIEKEEKEIFIDSKESLTEDVDKDRNVVELLEVLKSKAYKEKCETTVYKSEAGGYTYIEDIDSLTEYSSYFDEVMLGAWYDFLGMPIADYFPFNLDLYIQACGGNVSRYLNDFEFIDGKKYTIDELKIQDINQKATYALVLKDISIIRNKDGIVSGMLGNDFISGETILVSKGAYDVSDDVFDGNVVLVFGEYCGASTGDIPLFREIYIENITSRFSEEELAELSETVEVPKEEMLDLGIIGTDIRIDDFVHLPVDEKVVFKGEFIVASLEATGANFLYVENNEDGSMKYLFFVDKGDDSYDFYGDTYGYIEEELAWHAKFKYGSEVTDEIIAAYISPRFDEYTIEEISGNIECVDKLGENYYVCYMNRVNRTTIREEILNRNNLEKKVLYIGDSEKWSNEIEFKILDVGLWVDDVYGSNVYVDMELKGAPFASYYDLIDAVRHDLNVWGDGYLLNGGDFWAQVDGEKYDISDTSRLDYKGNSVKLRIYGLCSKIFFDDSEEIIAEFDDRNDWIIAIKKKDIYEENTENELSVNETETFLFDYKTIYSEVAYHIIEEENKKTGDAEYLMCYLYDINADNIDEFIVEPGFDQEDVGYDIYTTDGNHVNFVGHIPGRRPGLFKCDDQKGIYVYSNNYGNNYENIKHYTIENGKLLEKMIIEEYTTEFYYFENEEREELKEQIIAEFLVEMYQ